MVCGDETPGPIQRLSNGAIDIGKLTVWGFFTVSGYLITASWYRCKSLPRFLWHRVLRIYPAFLLCMAVQVFVIVPLAGGRWPDSMLTLMRWMAVDLVRLRSRHFPGVFPNNPESTINVSVWTIPYEFRCYLFVALLGIITVFPRKLVAIMGCLAFIVATLMPPPTFDGTTQGLWRLIALPSQYWYGLSLAFCAGILFYHFQHRIIYSHRLAALALIFMLIGWTQPLPVLATAVFGSYLIMYIAFNDNTICPQLAKKYGDMSYGAYLYGFPIEQLLVHYLGVGLTPLGVFALALPLSLLAGWLSWHLLENRCMRLKDWPRATSSSP